MYVPRSYSVPLPAVGNRKRFDIRVMGLPRRPSAMQASRDTPWSSGVLISTLLDCTSMLIFRAERLESLSVAVFVPCSGDSQRIMSFHLVWLAGDRQSIMLVISRRSPFPSFCTRFLLLRSICLPDILQLDCDQAYLGVVSHDQSCSLLTPFIDTQERSAFLHP